MSGSVAYTLNEIDDKIKVLKKEIEKWELRKKQAQNLLNLVKIKRRTNINSKAGLNKKNRSRKKNSKKRKRRRNICYMN